MHTFVQESMFERAHLCTSRFDHHQSSIHDDTNMIITVNLLGTNDNITVSILGTNVSITVSILGTNVSITVSILGTNVSIRVKLLYSWSRCSLQKCMNARFIHLYACLGACTYACDQIPV